VSWSDIIKHLNMLLLMLGLVIFQMWKKYIDQLRHGHPDHRHGTVSMIALCWLCWICVLLLSMKF